MSTLPLRRLFGLFLFGLPFVAHAQSIERAELCDVADEPSSFEGRKVSIRSHVESDGTHGAYLSEPGCKRGVVFGPDQGADWDEMNRVMEIGLPGTVRKSVEATWTGTIHFNGKVISLSVERIEDLSYELSDQWRHVPAG